MMSLTRDRKSVEVNSRDGRGWILVTRYILHRDGTLTWYDYTGGGVYRRTDDWRKVIPVAPPL